MRNRKALPNLELLGDRVMPVPMSTLGAAAGANASVVMISDGIGNAPIAAVTGAGVAGAAAEGPLPTIVESDLPTIDQQNEAIFAEDDANTIPTPINTNMEPLPADANEIPPAVPGGPGTAMIPAPGL